jgi:hypothetical protein
LEISFDEVMRLAGYAVPTPGSSDVEDSVKVLAQALQAEDLTATELEELGDYLQFRRQQRARGV